jgi:uncharacterized protein (DUF305 family)
MKIQNKPLALVVGAALLSASLVGCTINIGVPPQDGSSQSDVTSSFSNQDIMFAQMMIPHHQQAVDMSDLALSNSSNPEILSLAEKIKSEQATEITQMESWLDESNSTDHMGHSMEDMGMDSMGGMLTEEQMQELSSLSGNAFDVMFLTSMIEHHQGALQMVKMISQSQNPEAKALADAIVTTQTAEIEQMEQMLGNMS